MFQSCLLFLAVVVLADAFTIRSKLSMSLTGKALIVQNKGGGHGSIGYHLCKQLITNNPELKVTILQDKCNYSKPPFSSYEELKGMGAEIIDTNLSSDEEPVVVADSVKAAGFHYVIDNWSKSAELAAMVIDIAKQSNAKQYMFVSSAGMYKGGNTSPITEDDTVKTNGAREVEQAVVASGIPYTFMRPQYIYGPLSNKKYLDYFIGRAMRKLPIPLPLHGEQLVCLTNIVDVASLLACATGNEKAMNQIFNCGSDRYVTYKGLCQMIHKELGNTDDDEKYLFYEPKDFDLWKGSGVMQFPFRRDTFITSPSKAKLALGWTSKHTVQNDIAAEIAEYKASSDAKKEYGLDELRYDMEVIASKDLDFRFNYPFFDDAADPDEARIGKA